MQIEKIMINAIIISNASTRLNVEVPSIKKSY